LKHPSTYLYMFFTEYLSTPSSLKMSLLARTDPTISIADPYLSARASAPLIDVWVYLSTSLSAASGSVNVHMMKFSTPTISAAAPTRSNP